MQRTAQTFEDWLTTASDTKLVLEHDALCCILTLPGAHLFEGFAEQTEAMGAIWAELQRRRAARAASDERAAA